MLAGQMAMAHPMAIAFVPFSMRRGFTHPTPMAGEEKNRVCEQSSQTLFFSIFTQTRNCKWEKEFVMRGSGMAAC
jgi:hypothetical protein